MAAKSSSPFGEEIINKLHDVQNTLGKSREVLSDDDRVGAISEAKKLLLSLEKPEDVVMRFGYEVDTKPQKGRSSSFYGLEAKAFAARYSWGRVASQKGHSITAEKLALETGAEKNLIIRILRVLTAIDFTSETGKEEYAANNITKALTKPELEAGAVVCHDLSAMIEMRMHEYFREHGYTAPNDAHNCAFQWVFKTDKTYFEYVHQNPEMKSFFNTFMKGVRGTRRHWTEWWPVESELLGRPLLDKDEILIVDVGGGRGHDLERFITRFPDSKGCMVLQDLPTVINDLHALRPRIRAVPHNFFEPQPVQGALVYFTHFVLHDWPNSDCRKILQNVKAAMRPGHSRVLLNESIMPDKGCPSYFAAADLNMMANFGALIRTQSQWTELLQSVGLKVAKIWLSPYEGDKEGIIEARC